MGRAVGRAGGPGGAGAGVDSLGRGGGGRARRLDKGPRWPGRPNLPRRRELRAPP